MQKSLDEPAKCPMKTVKEEPGSNENNGGSRTEPKNPRIRHSFPKAQISVLSETKKAKSVNPEEFKTYCKKLFELEEVKIKKFRTWKEQRTFHKQAVERNTRESLEKAKKTAEKTLEKPSLPDGLKLITIPVLEMQKHDEKRQESAFNRKITKKTKKEWILNPKGKSFVCILHEYLQQSIKKPPDYKYSEIDSPVTPYRYPHCNS